MATLKVSGSGGGSSGDPAAMSPRGEGSRIANWKMSSGDDLSGGAAGNKQQHHGQPNLSSQAQVAALQAAAAAYSRTMSQQGEVPNWSDDQLNAAAAAAAAAAGGGGGAMDGIPEFVPGQPWQGGFKDDPSLTPSAMSNMLGVRSEHLAGLAGSEAGPNGAGAVVPPNMAQYSGGARGSGRGMPPMPPNIGGRPWMGDQSAFAKVQQQQQPQKLDPHS